MRFDLRWPDGSVQTCYSPSLVVAERFELGTPYGLADFLDRARGALREASERVRLRYGVPCARAMAELDGIERRARGFAAVPDAAVAVLAFHREAP